MAKVLITSKLHEGRVVDMDYIPRIGDTISCFDGYPKVVEVIWFPLETTSEMGDIDVGIVVN